MFGDALPSSSTAHDDLKVPSEDNIRMLSKALSKVQERKAVEYVEDSFMEITSAFKKRSASMRSANSENTEIVREQLRTFHDETSNSHSIY
jgi:hypothetical protein